MSEAFDLYKFTAPEEVPKEGGEYHVEPLTGEQWPRQRFLAMRAMDEVAILISRCLREDSKYFLDSRKDPRIELIPSADIEELYCWINKYDKEAVKKDPAFYSEVSKEIDRRRKGKL